MGPLDISVTELAVCGQCETEKVLLPHCLPSSHLILVCTLQTPAQYVTFQAVEWGEGEEKITVSATPPLPIFKVRI